MSDTGLELLARYTRDQAEEAFAVTNARNVFVDPSATNAQILYDAQVGPQLRSLFCRLSMAGLRRLSPATAARWRRFAARASVREADSPGWLRAA